MAHIARAVMYTPSSVGSHHTELDNVHINHFRLCWLYGIITKNGLASRDLTILTYVLVSYLLSLWLSQPNNLLMTEQTLENA